MSGIGSKLTELIPADDLHYSDYLGQYSIVSDEEVEKIVRNCIKAGLEEEDIYLYVLEIAFMKFEDKITERIAKGFVTCDFDPDTGTLHSFRATKENE